MPFTRFASLPTELKLTIISHADAISLTNLLKTSKEIRELTSYTINEKIAALTGLKNVPIDVTEPSITKAEDVANAVSGLHLISSSDSCKKTMISSIPNNTHYHHNHTANSEKTNNILISFFSPQNVEKKVDLYETKCFSNPNSNASSAAAVSPFYQSSRASSTESLEQKPDIMVNEENLEKIDHLLDNLNQDEDIYSTSKYNNNIGETNYSCFELGSLVKTRNPLTKKISPAIASNKKSSPMNLLIDEDSSFIKLTIQLSLSNQVTIFEKSEFFKTEWANNESQFLISQSKKFGLMFKLEKGEELPPRSPYDYEALTNFYLDIRNFMINNCYLLKCVEDATICI